MTRAELPVAGDRSQPFRLMIHRLRPLLAAIVLFGTVSACIDDPLPDTEGIPLTEAQAELLGLQTWRAALEARVAVDADTTAAASLRAMSLTGASLVPMSFSDSASVSEPCGISGSIDSDVFLAGVLDVETEEIALDFRIVQTHNVCRDQMDGTTTTLIGAPNIETEFVIATDGETLAVIGRVEGGIVIFSDGRSAQCDVQIGFAGLERPDGTSSYRLEGTVCGIAVVQDVHD